MKHYMDLNIEIDGHIYVEDVECEVEVETEVCHHEPYSWGQSRGTYLEVNAFVTSIMLGNLKLDRRKAEQVFGSDAMDRADEYATTYVEEHPDEAYASDDAA